MDGVSAGNAHDAGAGRNGWFVGHFIHDAVRNSADVEVKWGTHAKNDTNGGFAANKKARTLSVLVSGRFRIQFQGGNTTEEVILHAPGDFAMWNHRIPHNWIAEEESIVLTVRWPSVAGDQK